MNGYELAEELKKSTSLWFKDQIAGDWIIKTLLSQADTIQFLENELSAMREQVKYLEPQIYGGSTK